MPVIETKGKLILITCSREDTIRVQNLIRNNNIALQGPAWKGAHCFCPAQLYLDEEMIHYHGFNAWDRTRRAKDIPAASGEERQAVRVETIVKIIEENMNSGMNIVMTLRDQAFSLTVQDELLKHGIKANRAMPLGTDTGLLLECRKIFGIAGPRTHHQPRHSIVMVAGFPGSGKSTIGIKLSRKLGAALLDKDTVGRECSDRIAQDLNTYEGDHETNAFGAMGRISEYLDLGNIAAVNYRMHNTVLMSSPFTAQVRSFFNAKQSGNRTGIRELYLQDAFTRDNDAWADDEAWRLETVPLYCIYIKTSRVKEHVQLAKRGTSRDSYKLSHWNFYQRNQNRAEEKFSLDKWGKGDAGIYVLDNEFRPGLEGRIDEAVYSVRKFQQVLSRPETAEPYIWGLDTANQGEKAGGVTPEKWLDAEADIQRYDRDHEMFARCKDDREKLFFSDIMLRPEDLQNEEAIAESVRREIAKVRLIREHLNQYFWCKSNDDADRILAGIIVFDGSASKQEVTSEQVNLAIRAAQEAGETVKGIGFQNCCFADRLMLMADGVDIEFCGCNFKDGLRICGKENAEQGFLVSIFDCYVKGNIEIRDCHCEEVDIANGRAQAVIMEHVNCGRLRTPNVNVRSIKIQGGSSFRVYAPR